jgi:hypothetical protein
MVIRERGWKSFAVYHDELSAGVVADYLRRNDCPAQVMGCAGTALDNGVRVLVPGELLHRAQWLWALSRQRLRHPDGISEPFTIQSLARTDREALRGPADKAVKVVEHRFGEPTAIWTDTGARI